MINWLRFPCAIFALGCKLTSVSISRQNSLVLEASILLYLPITVLLRIRIYLSTGHRLGVWKLLLPHYSLGL